MPGLQQFAVVLAVTAVAIGAILARSVIMVREGYVGVIYRFGKLSDDTRLPGLTFLEPWASLEEVEIRIQTDYVENVQCGSSDGITALFSQIGVVNQLTPEHVVDTIRRFGRHYDKRLIYDQIRTTLSQICKSHTLREIYITKYDSLDERLAEKLSEYSQDHAPGLKIVEVRIQQPKISRELEQLYLDVVAQITKKEVELKKREAIMTTTRTAIIKETAEAEKEQTLRQLEAESNLKIAKIKAEEELVRAKSVTDAIMYEAEKQIKVDASRAAVEPSAAFLEWEAIRHLANTTKVYWGPSLPTSWGGGAVLAAASSP